MFKYSKCDAAGKRCFHLARRPGFGPLPSGRGYRPVIHDKAPNLRLVGRLQQSGNADHLSMGAQRQGLGVTDPALHAIGFYRLAVALPA